MLLRLEFGFAPLGLFPEAFAQTVDGLLLLFGSHDSGGVAVEVEAGCSL